MNIVTVDHRTTYRYASPVVFHEHALMLRPQLSKSMFIMDSKLFIDPACSIQKSTDRFGNIVETAFFDKNYTADTLTIVSHFTVAHRPRYEFDIENQLSRGEYIPLLPGESGEIMEATLPVTSDTDGVLNAWLRDTLRRSSSSHFGLIRDVSSRIFNEIQYFRRDSFGTQEPAQTIRCGTGTCRDYAWLLVEACRRLGFPSRFVSGYLYNEDAGDEPIGGGATHAWAEVHIPGAGWVDFDPTNGTCGSRNLIRSSSVLSPSQASPINGTYTGPLNCYIGMEVNVSTTSAGYQNQNQLMPIWSNKIDAQREKMRL